ncbi:MAG: hypothetical protein V7739_15540 [Motiliproteus sp.]
MNIFIMLLMLFVVSGHCSAAMAMTPSMPVIEDVSSEHQGHCGEAQLDTNHHSDIDSSCWDGHCSDTITTLQAQSFKQSKDQQDDAKPLIATMSALPPSRAGPCGQSFPLYSVDFVTSPLFYSLCVLRL